MSVPGSANESSKQGFLFKWTNYVKGYKKRYFVLQDGFFSYYRSKNEIATRCRGTLNMSSAQVKLTDALHFSVGHRSSQIYYLRAQSETDARQWVAALIAAKEKAKLYQQRVNSEDPDSVSERILAELVNRLAEMNNLKETLEKKVDELNKSIIEQCSSTEISERAGVLRVAAFGFARASSDFQNLADRSIKKLRHIWDKDKDNMLRLQQMVEDLAQQHSHLEQRITLKQNSPDDESSDDASFYDANDKISILSLTLDSKPRLQKPSKEKLNSIANTSNYSNPILSLKSVVPLQKGTVVRIRRTQIPTKPSININLWSILKNCIGKDLSRIPMPVNFSEPLSMLQRLTEDFEYSELLDEAAKPTTNNFISMALVAAFTVSSYATTEHRVSKPFNPLLGETYECDRVQNQGWRLISEQISHHPPVAAMHCESLNGWTCVQDFSMETKFRGKHLQLIPLGSTHLFFQHNNQHFSWRKVQSTVNNIVVGKLWIDNCGDMEIVNHSTGDRCHLHFQPYSYFSSDVPYRVFGSIKDINDRVVFELNGTWNGYMEGRSTESSSKNDSWTRLWTVTPLPAGSEKMYNFSQFAIELNEMEESVAPTDSRFRSDQRLMEEGRWDEANQEKERLELMQRQRRIKNQDSNGLDVDLKPNLEISSCWFSYCQDPDSGLRTVQLKRDYWLHKSKRDWSFCTKIF